MNLKINYLVTSPIRLKMKLFQNSSKIKIILDYLRYEELTSTSTATQEDVDNLVKEVKKGRWERTKKDLIR